MTRSKQNHCQLRILEKRPGAPQRAKLSTRCCEGQGVWSAWRPDLQRERQHVCPTAGRRGGVRPFLVSCVCTHDVFVFSVSSPPTSFHWRRVCCLNLLLENSGGPGGGRHCSEALDLETPAVTSEPLGCFQGKTERVLIDRNWCAMTF